MSALSVHRRIERQWAERVKSLKTIHGQIVLAAVPKPSAALKWRGELLLLPLLSCFPYASERLGHTSPALCPVCALLACVPLGPRPWLRRLRRRLPGIVRRLHGYYGGVRLPTVVHHRLRLLAFPMRTRAARVTSAAGRPWDLPVPLQEASAHARVCDHAGSSRRSLMARPCVWPSTFGTVSAPRMIGLSRFNGWPVHSPADASPAPLRASAHGSGPMWIATPSPYGTCTLYSLPVSRRTPKTFTPTDMGLASRRPDDSTRLPSKGHEPFVLQSRAS